MNALVTMGHILFGGVFVWLGILNFVKLKEKTIKAQSKKVPFARWSVAGSTLLIILGGLSIMSGYQTKIGSMLLIVFLIPSTLIFHDFWNAKEPAIKEADLIHFSKNLALIGAVLTFLGLS